jgi:hypothetical protein
LRFWRSRIRFPRVKINYFLEKVAFVEGEREILLYIEKETIDKNFGRKKLSPFL